jgi:hypothetical protein
MIPYILFSSNPSLAFLWSFLINMFYFSRISQLDKAFESIIREVEDEVEENDESVSIAVIEDKAYWVINNIFYQADVINGEIDRSSSKPINAFNMSHRDVTKMLFILDNLTEG